MAGAAPNNTAAKSRDGHGESKNIRIEADACQPWQGRRMPPANGIDSEGSRSPVPPEAASAQITMLSVRNCLAMRVRAPPNAPRSAISCRRAAARTSCRLAILAQAISSTKPNRRQQHHQRLSRISREVTLQGIDFQFPSFGHARQRRGIQMKPGLLERLQAPSARSRGSLPDAASQAHAKTLKAPSC